MTIMRRYVYMKEPTKRTILIAIISVLAATSAIGQDDLEADAFGINWQEISAEELRSQLESDFDVSARSETGRTPLMIAATYTTTPDVVQVLINAGARVDARDENGWTPLIYAANRDDPTLDVIQALLDADADVNARGDYGNTPLIVAVRSTTNLDIIDVLLEAGAEVNVRLNGRDGTDWTPLMVAANYNSNPGVIERLLEAGADATAESYFTGTAWDMIQDNEDLQGTDVYWELNQRRFE